MEIYIRYANEVYGKIKMLQNLKVLMQWNSELNMKLPLYTYRDTVFILKLIYIYITLHFTLFSLLEISQYKTI